jgi:hypothetical protein
MPLTGCHCSGEMRRFDVEVTLQPSLANAQGILPSVEVDLIGVSDANLPHWQQAVGVSEYFAPGSGLRPDPDSRHVMLLGQGKSRASLSASDEKLWDAWKKKQVMNLVILANYPRDTDKPPDQDPRRLIVPLDCARWDNQEKIVIEVNKNGLVNDTPWPHSKTDH